MTKSANFQKGNLKKKTNSIVAFSFCFSIYLMIPALMLAQSQTDYKVAIFLYDGVELLDFSGPGEVFGVTSGFSTYTVSVDGAEILSQGFVTVKPEYSIKNAPKPDILVLPGGGTRAVAQNQEVLDWIRQISTEGGINMSVCTGARILASAGLLDGLNVTTWYGFTQRLQDMLPNSTVLEDTRFVDSGNIITTAGVSAGIDGALHMVSRIKGLDEAKSTALYMEYDKWVPEDGKIDYKNEFIEKIKTNGLDQSLKNYPIDFKTGRPQFFEGEMKNLAMDFEEQGRTKEAISILDITVKAYPHSISSYGMLSDLYKKEGKFAPPKQNEFIETLTNGKIQEAIALYQRVQREYPGWKIFSEGYLDWAGDQYLQKEEFDKAIRIFILNVDAYPESAQVYESLGKAYRQKGNLEQARKYFEKALSVDPNLRHVQEVLETMNKL